MSVIDKSQQLFTKESIPEEAVYKESGDSMKNTMSRKALKWMYYICFVILIIVFVIEIYNAIHHYLERPTYTESHLVRQYHADFPAISICSDSGGFKQDILKVNINRQREQIQLSEKVCNCVLKKKLLDFQFFFIRNMEQTRLINTTIFEKGSQIGKEMIHQLRRKICFNESHIP